MSDQYSGMAVNERLYVSGLMSEFDKAVNEKDVSTVILILQKVELNGAPIEPILKHLGLNIVPPNE